MDTGYVSLVLLAGRDAGIDRADLTAALQQIQPTLFNELGIIIPNIRVQDDEKLASRSYQVLINSQRLDLIAGLEPEEFWVNLPAGQIAGTPWWDRKWKARGAIEPNSGAPAGIVRGGETERKLWNDNGYDTRNPLGYIVFVVAAQLRKRAGQLLSPELVRYCLDRLSTRFPALVGAARQYLDLESLTQTLRAQLTAGSSIKNLAGVLETILANTLLT